MEFYRLGVRRVRRERQIPADRLLQCPHGETEGEDRSADVVCGAAGRGGEPPAGEREEQRRVRELRDREAARPAHLAAPPKLGDGHRAHARRP